MLPIHYPPSPIILHILPRNVGHNLLVGLVIAFYASIKENQQMYILY